MAKALRSSDCRLDMWRVNEPVMALLSSIEHLPEASHLFWDFAMLNLVDSAWLAEEAKNAIDKITLSRW